MMRQSVSDTRKHTFTVGLGVPDGTASPTLGCDDAGRCDDLIASKNGNINIIDAHVVYVGQSIDGSHRTKVSKFDTPQLQQHASQELDVLTEFVRLTSITLEKSMITSISEKSH